MNSPNHSNSPIPEYSSRRTSSVNLFRETNQQSSLFGQPNHQSIGLGIRRSSNTEDTMFTNQEQERGNMSSPSSPSNVPVTPPPNYTDSNEAQSKGAHPEVTKAAVALNTVPESAWITSKDIGALRQLPYLNGMRAIATIIIEVAHMTTEGSPYVSFFGWFSLTTHFIQGAFLITGSLMAMQARPRKSKNLLVKTYEHLPQFFMARWVRLYPAVIAVLAINSIWWIQRYDEPIHLAKLLFRQFFKISQLKRIFYVSNDDPPNPFANMWFLDVQEHFYIFWAICLPFIVRFKTLGRFVCLAILFGLSFRKRLQEPFYNATLPLNLYKMVFGAAIYLIPIPRKLVMRYANKAAIASLVLTVLWGFSPRFQYGFTEDSHRMYGDNFAIVSVILVTLAAIAKGINDSDVEYQRERKAYLAQRAAEEVDQPFYVVYFQRLQDSDPLTLLDAEWLNFVGRISYSWYLWQVPLLHWERRFRSGLHNALGPTCEALACSLISTFFLEEPVRNLYTAHLKKQRALAIAAKAKADSEAKSAIDHHVSLQMPPFGTGKESHQE